MDPATTGGAQLQPRSGRGARVCDKNFRHEGRSMDSLGACPICESGAIGFFYAGRTGRRPADKALWNVWRCEACGHGFMNPRPTWRELSSYYTQDYDAYDTNHCAIAGEDDEAVRLAERTGELRHLPLPTGKRLLDVGCGAGWFLRIAKRLGAVVKGVEPNVYGARRAKDSGIDVYHGQLEDYAVGPGKKERFDLITANHVVEHVPDPSRILHTMKSLLAPGGTVWISVPNPACFFGRKLLDQWYCVDLPYHLQQFSDRSMTLAGERAGLAPRRQYTSSLPASVAASLRLYWRKRYFVPQKITGRIRFIDRHYAPRFGTQLDAAGDGEALITEFESQAANSSRT